MNYYRKENSTFRGEDPTWANACVGDNGSPQIFEYASGFASAANVLLDEVIKHRGIGLPVDVFIYPICFNMRHAVELFLKAGVSHIVQLAHIRVAKIPRFDIAESHDLRKIWEYFKINSLAADKRYAPMIEALEEYVVDIANVDATGQVFRYPFDTENRKHLTELALINAVVLKTRFGILEKRLQELNRFNENLLEEYGWGSFTPHLSRVQLVEIAAALPKRDQWKEPSFDAAKTYLREKNKLSSNEFSKVLNIIQERHEIAALIGITVEIPGINLQALEIFMDLWTKIHDIEELKNPSPPDLDAFSSSDFLDEMEDWHANRMHCRDALVEALTPDFLATLRALFYFHREKPYSEMFDRLLAIYRKEAIGHLAHPSQYKNDALHLLDKTNGMENILNSLNFLGQHQLLDALIDRYNLKDYRNRLLEISETQKSRLVEFSKN